MTADKAPAIFGQGGLEQCRSRLVRHAIGALAIGLTLLALMSAINLPYLLGIAIFAEQVVASAFAIGVALAFLSVDVKRRPRTTLPWYDALAAMIGLLGGLYIAVRFASLVTELADPPLHNLIIGSALLLLLAEALRRTTGLILVGVLSVFLAYAFFGDLVPGPLQGRDLPFADVVGFLTMEQGLVARPLVIASTVVVAFIFFGQLLFASGGSSYFTDLSTILMGRYRGGSAKIAISASALFGSISGSAVSNVATTGVITIPLMVEGGYSRKTAAAVEAGASTGGQIMPPVMGAAAFLMAQYLSVPYSDIVLAAILPAVLYFIALFIQADLEAGRRGISRIDEKLIPRVDSVIYQGWFFPIPFVVLIGGLFWLNQAPDLAAFYGAAALFAAVAIFGYRGRRLGPRDVVLALRSTGMVVVEIIIITSAAGVIIGVLNLTGLGFGMPLALLQLGITDTFSLAVLSAAICIVLGMGMPTLAVYVLLAGLVAPALVQAGIEPMAAHLFIMYFGVMSMVTPPVAIAAFAAATLAGSTPMATGFAAMRFAWPAYIVPFLFLWAPSLLLRGEAIDIAITVVSAVAGVFLVCVGTAGYLIRQVAPVSRILFGSAGIALLLPVNLIPYGGLVNLGGLGLAILLVGREVHVRRKSTAASRSINISAVSLPMEERNGGGEQHGAKQPQ